MSVWFDLLLARAGGCHGWDYHQVVDEMKFIKNMDKLIAFASVFVSTAVPRVPKLSILMQALFCAHWEHTRSTQTHQREETQEEHNGMEIPMVLNFVLSLVPVYCVEEIRVLNFVVYVLALVYQEKQEENELRALPPASATQLRAVDACVRETARQHGISEEDFEVRKAVVVRMEEIIKKHLSGCILWCHSAWFIFPSVSCVKRGNALRHIRILSPTKMSPCWSSVCNLLLFSVVNLLSLSYSPYIV